MLTKTANYYRDYLPVPFLHRTVLSFPFAWNYSFYTGEHNNKARGKHTVTIGAPTEIKGISGNVGVVVKMNGKHAYSARVLLPDGSVFVFSENKKHRRECIRECSKMSLLPIPQAMFL